MRKLVERIKTNPFFSNVAILASGTIVSQMIVIATSPLLSRLYSVESFGILSLFTSYLTIAAVVSTGRYELALALPNKEEDAKKLVQLILYIAIGVSSIYFVGLFFVKYLGLFQSNELIKQSWIYIAPVYIFFIAVNSAVVYWYQRKKEYRKVTIISFLQVVLTVFFSLILGYFFHLESGLVLSLVISSCLAGLYLLFDFLKDTQLNSREEVLEQAEKYKGFPKYMIVSDLSLAGSQQLTPIVFSFLFNTTVVGFYSMANRMIRLPNIVITSAIGNVFRNDALEEMRMYGNCRKVYIATFKKLVLLSTPIYLLVFLFSPFLFSFFFGQVWRTAGEYARILSVLLFFEFIASPLSLVLQICQKQKIISLLQFFNAIFGGFAICIGYYFFHDAFWSLILFSMSSVFFNFISLYLSYKYSVNEN